MYNGLDDKMHEECGVFGIYDPEGKKDLVRLTYYALYALQHRGQESAGIAVSDGEKINVHKGMGLVPEVFSKEVLDSLKGKIAVGHVRYSTTGSTNIVNAMPLVVRYRKGSMALCHNGNLVNAFELRKEMEQQGTVFQTTIDSEVIANLIARGSNGIEEAVTQAMYRLKGSYALIIMTDDKLIGLRDPKGIRPLSLGKLDGAYVLASESCAFDTIGADFIRDVEPGEMIVIDENKIESKKVFNDVEKALCIFEFVYFARPDSIIDGSSVHMARLEAGRILAREHPADADLVIGVPDSGTVAAMGFAEESGIPFGIGLIKNRYIGRTFIQPSQVIRQLGVKLKLNALKSAVKGKRLVMVDDSIVRGTTSGQIVQMLKDAGAAEVHVRVSSPPITHSCYFGIDTSTRKELIGAQYSVEEICKHIKADSLGYLSLEGLIKSTGLPRETFCAGCFCGKYCIEVPGEGDKYLFEKC
ncbi:MAG: amidophosphoribosyltransferase [Thermosediminibacterales bacterium]|nr:amidophosphoribosyltransferase [Thermosediminibacterales bacterium]MDK2835321.1 amidophosphoribosyltransferase [Thermosediminibacterales bacterium]